ncbi:MAG: hypothetical protein ABR572_06005 [Cryomorphaceae bacterium]|nr:hypothetical protein [Flavobacteriales bacterium]
MKAIHLIGLFTAAILTSATARAQLFTPTGLIGQTVGGSGNGVGTDTPGAKLHVKGFLSPTLFLEPEAQANIGGGWDYPETMLDIHGLLGTQGVGVPPNFGTVFHVDANGNTQIGEFPSVPPNKLSVRNSMGVYSSTTTWMRMLFAGGGSGSAPELNWRATGDNHFRIKNDQTNVTGLTLAKDGQVGVGTNNFAGDHSLYVEGTAVMDWLTIQKPAQWGGGTDYLQLKHEVGPEIKWQTSDNSNLRFHGNGFDVMLLSSEGKVGVGKDFLSSYFLGSNHSLYVKGSAVAEEIFVKLQADWADFVFEPDYPLMPLQELDTYLKQNKHLPDFPSAAEVKENGLALGETERLLTIKVEELTLYLLRMNEEMEALREEITTLKGEK